jgi:hypothetical protein
MAIMTKDIRLKFSSLQELVSVSDQESNRFDPRMEEAFGLRHSGLMPTDPFFVKIPLPGIMSFGYLTFHPIIWTNNRMLLMTVFHPCATYLIIFVLSPKM